MTWKLTTYRIYLWKEKQTHSFSQIHNWNLNKNNGENKKQTPAQLIHKRTKEEYTCMPK